MVTLVGMDVFIVSTTPPSHTAGLERPHFVPPTYAHTVQRRSTKFGTVTRGERLFLERLNTTRIKQRGPVSPTRWKSYVHTMAHDKTKSNQFTAW